MHVECLAFVSNLCMFVVCLCVCLRFVHVCASLFVHVCASVFVHQCLCMLSVWHLFVHVCLCMFVHHFDSAWLFFLSAIFESQATAAKICSRSCAALHCPLLGCVCARSV